MRLYRFINDEFNLTKSQTKKFFLEHKILVDNKIPFQTTIINENSVILIDSKRYFYKKKSYVYLAFNKPKGIVCTNDRLKEGNISSFLNLSFRLSCIGRLDKDSSGLIILTNDGKFSFDCLNSNNHVEKKYYVEVDKDIDECFLKKMANGILIKKKVTKNCELIKVNNYSFYIILKEGMNRQIRRMCMACNRKVLVLKRVQFGKLKLNDLEEGKYIYINKDTI